MGLEAVCQGSGHMVRREPPMRADDWHSFPSSFLLVAACPFSAWGRQAACRVPQGSMPCSPGVDRRCLWASMGPIGMSRVGRGPCGPKQAPHCQISACFASHYLIIYHSMSPCLRHRPLPACSFQCFSCCLRRNGRAAGGFALPVARPAETTKQSRLCLCKAACPLQRGPLPSKSKDIAVLKQPRVICGHQLVL